MYPNVSIPRCLNLLVSLWYGCCWLWLGGEGALADGKAFSQRVISTEVTMPDQRALLSWSNGVERLVIETRILGDGTNFAWVVPLPAPPTIEAATTGLFPTLLQLSAPRVVDRGNRSLAWWWVVAALGWFVLAVRPGTDWEWTDWGAGFVLATGLSVTTESWGIGPLLAAWPLFIVARVRREEPVFLSGLVVLVNVLVLAGMLLPAHSKALAKSTLPLETAMNGVDVVAHQRAGVFESTTLAARDPAALRNWLTDHGYRVPDSALPVISDYVRDGWVFVASQVRREVSVAEPQALHPLTFTFKTSSPVYPLRLTAVENGPLKLELFVFGPQRAAMDGMSVVDARPTSFPPPPGEGRLHPDRESLVVAHPGLAALVPGAPFATRLQGTLSPADMRSDARLNWNGSDRFREVKYSRRGAVEAFLLQVVTGWCAGWLGLAVGRRIFSWNGWCLGLWAGGVMLLGLGFGLGLYPGRSVVPVRRESPFHFIARRQDLEFAAAMAMADRHPAGRTPTVESVRAALEPELLATAPGVLAGVREEDSPRNYVVRSVSGEVEVVFFGEWGEERVLRASEYLRH